MGETVKPIERSFHEETSQPIEKEAKVALSKNDVMVQNMTDSILAQNATPANTERVSKEMTEDLKDEALQRISSFVADIAKANFSTLDDDVIELATIESLLHMIIDMIERDLQESQRLSEQTKKLLIAFEKEYMEKAKNAYTDSYLLEASAASNVVAGFAPLAASAAGWDPVAASVLGRGIQSGSQVPEGYRQQAISTTQMDKQQASKMTDQERGDNQQIMKRLQDLKALRDQILQLKLQAARNQ